MVELTDREYQVYKAICDRKPMPKVMTELGLTRQRLSKLRAQLVDRGVIRRRDDIPKHASRTDEYPWEPTGVDAIRKQQQLPLDAVLRVAFPREHQRDRTVAPVPLVRWRQWSVQALPMRRLDGRVAKDVLSTHRMVVVADLDTGMSRSFMAEIGRDWAESDTVTNVGRCWPMSPDVRRDLTNIIGCALGVDAVMNVTEKTR